MSPELDHQLSDLAGKLGVSVERLWSVLTRQAFFEGVYDLFRAGLAFCFLAACAAAGWWYYRRPSQAAPPFEGFDRAGGAAIAALAAFMFTVFYAESLRYALTEFGNPEYFALERLAKLLRP